LTLGVRSSNVTWMEALCLLCQSEVADQMKDPQDDASKIEILAIWV